MAYLVLVIEGALSEREEQTVMGRKESQPRYTLAKLLDREFKLDPPDTGPKTLMDLAAMGNGLVKAWPGKENQHDDQLDGKAG